MAVRLARSNTSTALTGSHPVPSVLPAADDGDSKGLKGAGAGGGGSAASLAGTTHPLRIETPYYTATVPVWLDLIPDLVRETAGPESSSLVGSEGAEPTPPTVEHPADEWARTFLSPEAAEVREALGGVCVVFAFPSSSSSNRATGSRERQSTEALLGAVGRVVQQGLGGLDWDGVALAIGVGPGAGETGQLSDEEEAWIEDLCAEVLGGGVEFIHVRSLGAGFSASRKAGNASSSLEDSEGRNQYGEKTGMARVLEALQANDWTAAGGDGVEDILGDSDDDKDGEASSASGEIRESTAGNRHTRDMDLDPAALDFGFDREDFAGLQQAIWQASQEREDQEEGDSGEQDEGAGKKTRTKKGGSLSGDDDEELNEESVQRVETLMRRLMAAREAAQGLPEDQRRRLAARAVGEVMRDL